MKFKLNHVTDTDWIRRIFDIAAPGNTFKACKLIKDLSPAMIDAEMDWITAIMFWAFGFCTASIFFI